jgi:hypothetical protein
MTRERVPGIELETPTEILAEPPAVPPGPGTIQMISMKTPAELAAETAKRTTKPVQVQLRAMSEASGRHFPTPPGGLGYLAPPLDPARAPKRASPWLRAAGMVICGLALATAIATAIWFLA